MSKKFPYRVVFTEKTTLRNDYGKPVAEYPEGYVVGNFADDKVALNIFGNLGYGYKVIDTRPQPKIPDNANVISYYLFGKRFIAFRYGHPANKVWALGTESTRLEETQLIEEIGQSDVTVLEEL